jgi:hypothetical protein
MSDNQLEKEFKVLAESIGKEIDDKVAEAAKLLNEAVSLSDRFGIPFRSPISQIDQAYVPTSFKVRFNTLDKEMVCKMLEMYKDELNYARGWRHSQVGC